MANKAVGRVNSAVRCLVTLGPAGWLVLLAHALRGVSYRIWLKPFASLLFTYNANSK